MVPDKTSQSDLQSAEGVTHFLLKEGLGESRTE